MRACNEYIGTTGVEHSLEARLDDWVLVSPE